MDIRNWPIDRIMQLPDHCFGRKWPITFAARVAVEGVEMYVSAEALPELCVLWRATLYGYAYAVQILSYKFALGDKQPITDAEFDALEPLIPVLNGDGFWGLGYEASRGYHRPFPMRLPIAASGRRIVVRFDNSAGTSLSSFGVQFLISSFPTEVPDCLLLGRAKSL